MNADPARRNAFRLAIVSGALACAGALAIVFLWRNPDVLEPERGPDPIFRVQSRSMEPSFRGQRFLWLCSNCRASFATSVDVGPEAKNQELVETDAITGATARAPGDNSQSYDVRSALAKTRFVACPKCGFDRVPAVDPDFEDGSTVRVCPVKEGNGKLEFAARLKRALRRETSRKFREQEKRDAILTPKRWDVVVYRDALGRLTLKRVVGLPGELVTFTQGDVLVNGVVPRRTLDEALQTATPMRNVEFRRSDERVDVMHVSRLWTDEGTKAIPTAISNESPIPCSNGSNVAPVELARDFIFRFNWYAEDAAATRFAVLARRSERAFLIVYNEATRSLVVRSKALFDGVTASGRPFEQLTEADFASEPGVHVEIQTAIAPDARFTVATLDGELIFAADDELIASFSTDDLHSTQVAAISTPFVLLGPVARARNLALYRDLHYSNVSEPSPRRSDEIRTETLTGKAVKTQTGKYFLLGDNSPASIDSRFASAGTVDERDVLFIVAQ